MQEIIDEKDWAKHPFLRKVSVHSDFDGWHNYFTVRTPSTEDRDFARHVTIEFSQNGGPWIASDFEEQVTFIDFSSFAWDRAFVHKNQDPAGFSWRAVISD
jgi:hypothetical protein